MLDSRLRGNDLFTQRMLWSFTVQIGLAIEIVRDQYFDGFKVTVRQVFETLFARGDSFVDRLKVLDGLDQMVIILRQFELDGLGERPIPGQRGGCFRKIA